MYNSGDRATHYENILEILKAQPGGAGLFKAPIYRWLTGLATRGRCGKSFKLMLIAPLMLVACQSTALLNPQVEVTPRRSQRSIYVRRSDPVPADEIIEAVKSKDASRVRELIRQGAPLDKRNSYWTTPLHVAIELFETEIIELLLDAGSDASIIDWVQDNALTLAAEVGNPDAVRSILRHGFNPDMLSGRGSEVTPLMIAAYGPGGDANYFNSYGRHAPGYSERNRPYLACMKLLIEAGADLNFRRDSISILMAALLNSNYQAAVLLEEAEEQRRKSKPESLSEH